MKSRFSALCSCFLALAVLEISVSAAEIAVPGKSTIYGAGLLSPPGGGTLPPSLTFPPAPGQVLTFSSVIGTVNSGPFRFGADGQGARVFYTDMADYSGLSGIRAGTSFFLIGVFLDDSPPGETAPPALDFRSDGLGPDFVRLAPLIGQTFYIGDGRTGQGSTGTVQNFLVPPTATRLFLGLADGWDGFGVAGLPGYYADNDGAFVADALIAPWSPPVSIRVAQVELGWPTQSNMLYQVQFRSSLTSMEWTDVGAPTAGNGSTNNVRLEVAADEPQTFYRVQCSTNAPPP